MKFTACNHLRFDDAFPKAQKQVLANGKVFWLRDTDTPRMVQFCMLRGRLNSPESCLSAGTARCSHYEEVEHDVPDELISE